MNALSAGSDPLQASTAWLLGSSVFHSAQPARISAADPVFSSPGVRACATPASVTVWLCATNQPLPLAEAQAPAVAFSGQVLASTRDRKSTRLNSSHSSISYAVFC